MSAGLTSGERAVWAVAFVGALEVSGDPERAATVATDRVIAMRLAASWSRGRGDDDSVAMMLADMVSNGAER
jgi:hypothetical protein